LSALLGSLAFATVVRTRAVGLVMTASVRSTVEKALSVVWHPASAAASAAINASFIRPPGVAPLKLKDALIHYDHSTQRREGAKKY